MDYLYLVDEGGMRMIHRIHILGASGSGTTTLANELSKRLDYKHLDTDDYYWIKTEPPFQEKRDIQERLSMMEDSFEKNKKWILSGSLCGWGDQLIPYFDLVIFLWIPKELRISRLIDRERAHFGKEIDPGESMHKNYMEFIEWAETYDDGDMSIVGRNIKKHNDWLNTLPCEVLRLEGDITLEDKVTRILKVLDEV